MKIRESETKELKCSWQDTNLKTLCAFANSSGGAIYNGVGDDGEICGIHNAKKIMEDIPNKIVSKLGIIANVILKNERGKDVILVSVEKSETPISYNGKYYIRSGSTTHELGGKELTKFLLSKSINNWDEYVVPSATLQDINPDTIKLFKNLAGERLPFVKNKINISSFLEKLNLSKKDGLTRASLLLFGLNPKKHFVSSFIRIGRFDESGELISNDTFEGNLFEQVENCISVLKSKYLIAQVKFDGIYRKDVLEFPERVIREAIINAVIHRDYIGAHTQIKIFPKRITIWNEGGLPGGLTIDDLKKEHPSRPRNELLADIFFKAGLIDTWGHGTLKMISLCKEAGLPEPRFSEEAGGFSVSLFNNSSPEMLGAHYGLNQRQIEGIAYLKEHGKISNKIYQEVNHVSKATASKDLSDLVKKTVLIKNGQGGAGISYEMGV